MGIKKKKGGKDQHKSFYLFGVYFVREISETASLFSICNDFVCTSQLFDYLLNYKVVLAHCICIDPVIVND